MKTTITIKGTHCKACGELIKEVCSEFPAIKSCAVDVKTGKTVLEHEGAIDLKKVKKEIEKVGKYTVLLP